MRRMRYPDIAMIRRIRDAEVRARSANDAMKPHQDALTELGDVRRDAVREMAATGMTQVDIAERLEITAPRVWQMLAEPKTKETP